SASANRGRTGFALLRLEGGTTATTAATTAAVQPRTASVIPKRARPRHRHHHRIAPHPVPSWFINANSFRELKRFAATDACAFARNQRRGSRRTLILDFGGARAYGGGAWFGATVNHEGLTASNSQIAAALKVAADAY